MGAVALKTGIPTSDPAGRRPALPGIYFGVTMMRKKVRAPADIG